MFGLLALCLAQTFVYAYIPLDRIVAVVNEDVGNDAFRRRNAPLVSL